MFPFFRNVLHFAVSSLNCGFSTMINDVKILGMIRYNQFDIFFIYFKPQAPVAQKMRMRWFFDVSKVKESSFLKSDLTAPPPQIFVAHLLENTDLSPSIFHFQWVLYKDHILSQMVL